MIISENFVELVGGRRLMWLGAGVEKLHSEVGEDGKMSIGEAVSPSKISR